MASWRRLAWKEGEDLDILEAAWAEVAVWWETRPVRWEPRGRGWPPGPWAPFPRVLGSHRGVRERQWPERRCTFWGYLGVAMSRGSESLVWVTPEVTPTLESRLPRLESRLVPLLAVGPVSWFLISKRGMIRYRACLMGLL